MATKAAKMVARSGHLDWCCPVCGKLMAKVYDNLVIVKTSGAHVAFPIDSSVTVTCAKCITETTAHQDEAA